MLTLCLCLFSYYDTQLSVDVLKRVKTGAGGSFFIKTLLCLLDKTTGVNPNSPLQCTVCELRPCDHKCKQCVAEVLRSGLY